MGPYSQYSDNICALSYTTTFGPETKVKYVTMLFQKEIKTGKLYISKNKLDSAVLI